ncbi:hypothetical protein T08_10244 [Trichinella sp. T8]|nr:hypothetical protein T08_10244 [Trichinella sp. T8]
MFRTERHRPHRRDPIGADDVPRSRTEIKKWWWNLFSHALNMAVVAAWKLHMELHTAPSNQLPYSELRREITIHLLHS